MRPAFSLIELAGVLCILAVMAASATPAVLTITNFKVEAVRTEVTSYLVFARETAAATGMPTGVRLNVGSQQMSYVQITSTGAAPSTMLDAAGQPRPAIVVDRHGGACLSSVTGTGPGLNGDIVWFGVAGVPEHRQSNGQYIEDAPGDMTIAFTSGEPLIVRAHTGVVE